MEIKIPYTLHQMTQDILAGRKMWDEAMQKARSKARRKCFDEANVRSLDDCIADLTAAELEPSRYMTVLAAILCNLVPVYQKMGDLQRARQCCENSLTLAEKVQDTDTEDICYDNLGNLGINYRQQGQPKEAADCYKRVLEHKRDDQGRGLWLGNLALAQRDLGELEEAVCSAKSGLKLAQEADDKKGIAVTRNILGILYHEMGQLETALKHYLAVLEPDTNRQTENLQEECATLIHIGLAYRELRQPKVALAHYQQAAERAQGIEDQDIKNRIENYALGNQGLVQRELGQTQEAIKSLEKALHNSAIDPSSKAIYLNVLGLAYRDIDQIEQAISYFQEAQEINKQIGNPRGIARNLANLGGLYLRQNQMADARTNLVRALCLSRKSKDWEDMWRLYWHLGEVTGHGRGRWSGALRYFERAIELLEGWRADLSLGLRQQTMQDKVTVYQQAILAAKRLERFDRALELAERAKTRYLSDVLTHRDQRTTSVSEDLWDTYTQAQEQLQRQLRRYSSILQPSLSDGTSKSGESLEYQRKHQQQLLKRSQKAQEKLFATWTHLDEIVDQIRTQEPNFQEILYTAPLTFRQIRNLTPTGDPKAALVEFVVTREGTAIFIVTAEQERLLPENFIWVDDFTESDLNQFMDRRDGEGDPGDGWVNDYLSDQRVGWRVRWRETMERVTGALWNRLFARVHDRLQMLGVKRLILIPHRALHLLPLPALHRIVDGQRRYLIDDYDEITFVPSAFILSRCQARAEQPERHKVGLLAVANTRPKGAPLPGSEVELALLDALFARYHHARKCLLREEGTPKAVLDNLPAYSHVHFACHGAYEWQNPLDSCLYFYGPGDQVERTESDKESPDPPAETLTLSEIQDLELSHVRLITLSACETAMTDPDDRADEYVGLTAGFLMAGVPAVVASLWSVDDLATMLLMERFYVNYFDDMTLPGALREAQCWLRDVTARELFNDFSARLNNADNSHLFGILIPARRRFEDKSARRPFEHPFYWSAFIFSGAWSE